MSTFLDPTPGSHLDDAIRVALDVVRLTNEECVVVFNGIILRAGISTKKADLLRQWEAKAQP